MSMMRGYLGFLLVDPTGLSICKEPCSVVDRDLQIGRAINSTYLYPVDVNKDGIVDGDTIGWGTKFTQTFMFDGDCKCCEYRQFVSASGKASIITPSGAEITLPGSRSRFNNSFHEDCIGDFCYGYRSKNPNSGDGSDDYLDLRQNGCTYKMRDTPGFKISEIRASFVAANPAVEDFSEFRFVGIQKLTFAFYIVDTCAKDNKIINRLNGDKIVWRDSLSIVNEVDLAFDRIATLPPIKR